MKKIETIIRPEKFQPLRKALSSIGIGGLTVTEAAGTGKQKGQTGVFRGTTFQIQLLPKIKVEMIVEDNQLDEIVSIILETCSTGNIGDGKIFVYPVEEVIRIRTGERGNEAVI
ncbi:P-II family nitrogen regulator [Oceanobacillus kapialis]|uniref:P-II family nitrogen regulator n=1 Tax=Oceanobacillus kapialis TaxID=481353 RepID=A0ABW5Q2I2_9BACI